MDIEKISGGSAEMYWRGAFPGLFLGTQQSSDGTPAPFPVGEDLQELKDQIEDYIHSLTRYVALQGMDVKQLQPQVESPEPAINTQILLISSGTGIPQRILTGSERGELASSMDQENWTSRVIERRADFAEDIILRRFVERVAKYGILKPPEVWAFSWPDMQTLNEERQARVSKDRSVAIREYSMNPDATLLYPVELWYKTVMGLNDEEIAFAMELHDKYAKEFKKEGDDSVGDAGKTIDDTNPFSDRTKDVPE